MADYRSLDDATNAEWEAAGRAHRQRLADIAPPEFQSPEPRLNVLAEAARITSGDRQQAYGHPEQNLGGIAEAWNAYLRRRYGADAPVLDARAVALMNVLAKVIRDANRPKRDNLIDICGYARTAEMLDEADE